MGQMTTAVRHLQMFQAAACGEHSIVLEMKWCKRKKENGKKKWDAQLNGCKLPMQSESPGLSDIRPFAPGARYEKADKPDDWPQIRF